MMRQNRLQKLMFLIPIIFFGIALLAAPEETCASNGSTLTNSSNGCEIQNTFPNNRTQGNSHFGAQRPGRFHAGVDFFYPKGTSVVMPEGCTMRAYQDGTPIWKTDPNGYGQYVFVDCTPAGIPVTLRYAHIAGTNGDRIEQGRTGISTASIPDHYHFEVLLNQDGSQKGTPIDPECVLGINKDDGGRQGVDASCKDCPVLANTPFDFCKNQAVIPGTNQIDPSKSGLEALLEHSRTCYKGPDKNNPGGQPITREQLQGTQFGDPTFGTDGPSDGHSHDDDGYHTHDYQDTPLGTGFQGTQEELDRLYDNSTSNPRPPEVPGEPPVPPTPGQPGGDPDLVIKIPTYEGVEFKNGCATDTWTAMVNQAVIEARREDILNKRFIVKPDSVLDYGCFDTNLATAQSSLGPIFSETAKWSALEVSLWPKMITVKRYHPAGLKNALASVVERAAQSYYNQQFNQPPLSGSTPVGGVTGAKNCSLMGKVWSAAKCKNFDDVKVFYTFDDLRNTEPREYPPNMRCDG